MKKNAFTSISLLIVIALIAIPVVLYIVTDSSEGGIKSKINSYINSVKKDTEESTTKLKYNPSECTSAETCNTKENKSIVANKLKKLKSKTGGNKVRNFDIKNINIMEIVSILLVVCLIFVIIKMV